MNEPKIVSYHELIEDDTDIHNEHVLETHQIKGKLYDLKVCITCMKVWIAPTNNIKEE